MQKYLIIFLIAFLVGDKLKAQSTVHIYDLNPVSYTDSVLAQSGMIRLNVNYKIQNIAQADSVYFMRGSNSNASDVGVTRGKVIFVNGNYYVAIGAEQFPIARFETTNAVILPAAQYILSKYISVKVKDKSGNMSNTVSIRIN